MKMDALRRRRRRKQLREEMRDERGRERDGESDRRIAIHFVDILYAVIPLQYIIYQFHEVSRVPRQRVLFLLLHGLFLKYFLFKNILK